MIHNHENTYISQIHEDILKIGSTNKEPEKYIKGFGYANPFDPVLLFKCKNEQFSEQDLFELFKEYKYKRNELFYYSPEIRRFIRKNTPYQNISHLYELKREKNDFIRWNMVMKRRELEKINNAEQKQIRQFKKYTFGLTIELKNILFCYDMKDNSLIINTRSISHLYKDGESNLTEGKITLIGLLKNEFNFRELYSYENFGCLTTLHAKNTGKCDFLGNIKNINEDGDLKIIIEPNQNINFRSLDYHHICFDTNFRDNLRMILNGKELTLPKKLTSFWIIDWHIVPDKGGWSSYRIENRNEGVMGKYDILEPVKSSLILNQDSN